jgi:DNA (cytosine-5)-methyltransferase 1
MRILDLFCGAGGAAMGYSLAFPDAEIVGHDINLQPRYPFTFMQADVMDVLGNVAWLQSFDVIHASPPCQAHTTMSNRWRGSGGAADAHHDFIADVRRALSKQLAPWVIENVPGARRLLINPVTLSGGAFGLGVERPRLFETSFPVSPPAFVKVSNPVGVYGKLDGRRIWTRTDGTSQYAARTLAQAQPAMGVDWMEWRELAESIPPAYSRYIAEQWLQTLGSVAA